MCKWTACQSLIKEQSGSYRGSQAVVCVISTGTLPCSLYPSTLLNDCIARATQRYITLGLYSLSARCLIMRSNYVSKALDWMLKPPYHFEIRQASQQQRQLSNCRMIWQIQQHMLWRQAIIRFGGAMYFALVNRSPGLCYLSFMVVRVDL